MGNQVQEGAADAPVAGATATVEEGAIEMLMKELRRIGAVVEGGINTAMKEGAKDVLMRQVQPERKRKDRPALAIKLSEGANKLLDRCRSVAGAIGTI